MVYVFQVVRSLILFPIVDLIPDMRGQEQYENCISGQLSMETIPVGQPKYVLVGTPAWCIIPAKYHLGYGFQRDSFLEHLFIIMNYHQYL